MWIFYVNKKKKKEKKTTYGIDSSFVGLLSTHWANKLTIRSIIDENLWKKTIILYNYNLCELFPYKNATLGWDIPRLY